MCVYVYMMDQLIWNQPENPKKRPTHQLIISISIWMIKKMKRLAPCKKKVVSITSSSTLTSTRTCQSIELDHIESIFFSCTQKSQEKNTNVMWIIYTYEWMNENEREMEYNHNTHTGKKSNILVFEFFTYLFISFLFSFLLRLKLLYWITVRKKLRQNYQW